MLEKHEVIRDIKREGIVAVIRSETMDGAYQTAKACYAGGIRALEVTFTVPRALQLVESLDAEVGQQALVGVGTVLDPETARLAILSGAKFVVTPYLNLDVLKLCNRYGIPCFPGAMNLSEVMKALEYGADVVKLFPGEAFGPQMVKALKGPIPHVHLMPTGGVTLNNVADWIKNGATAVGIGSALTGPAKKGDYIQVAELAREFVGLVQQALKGRGLVA